MKGSGMSSTCIGDVYIWCKSQARTGFEVLTAVSMKIAVFWVVAPCSLVEVYQRFRGPCRLHHQGDITLT
jgi:hypothetical protein